MQKFRDVLSRWEARQLSMLEAGELLAISERQLRRYRDRFEEEGEEGLRDRRLGKPSSKRVPAAERERMLELYRGCYRVWNVKQIHEHLQDRLINDLAKAGITAIDAPNCWIREVYPPAHNARFAKPAALLESCLRGGGCGAHHRDSLRAGGARVCSRQHGELRPAQTSAA
jgi:hypothetical protein